MGISIGKTNTLAHKTQADAVADIVNGFRAAERSGAAYRKIRLGASLVQLITGLVYEGPQLIAQINRDLGRFLQRDGHRLIAEAAGVDAS